MFPSRRSRDADSSTNSDVPVPEPDAFADLPAVHVVWDWDLASNRLWWGPALQERFGWDASALEPRPSTWLERIHPDDRERVEDGLRAAMAGLEETWTSEYRFRRADGIYVGVRDRAHIVYGEGEDPRRVVGSMVDLTALHAARESSQRRIRQQSLLADLAGQAIATDDLDLVFELACIVLAEGLGVEHAKVLEHRPTTRDLLLRAGIGWDNATVGTTTVPDHAGSQAGYTLSQRAPVVAEDLDEETRFAGPDLLLDHGVRSGISVPIRTSRGTWGVLGAHASAPGTFSDEDVDLLINAASLLGAAIERIRDHERFELASEATNDVLWDYDVVEDDLWYSPRMEEVFGWQPEEVDTFVSWSRRVHDADLEHVLERLEAWVQSGRGTWEDTYRFQRANGSWARVHDHATLVTDTEGNPIRAVGSIQDRTEEIAAQERLALQARMLDEVGQAVIATDAEGAVTYWNDAAERMYGWTAAEALGANVVELTVPEEANVDASEILASMVEGQTWAGEFQVQRKDGSRFPAIVADSPIFGGDGELAGVIGVTTDITAQKTAEQALEQNRARLDHLLREAPTVIFTTDPGPPWDVTWMCPNIDHVLGASMQAFERDPQLWWKRIPEDDRASIAQQMAALEDVGKVSVEHRWRDGDSVRWLQTDLRLVHRDGDQPWEIVGSSIEITDRVRAEEQLRESEQRFRELAESIDSVFWLTTPDQSEGLYVSPAFEEIWGRPISQLGEGPEGLLETVHPGDHDIVQRYFREQAGEAEAEYRIVRPDGEVRWIRDRAFPVLDDDGEIVRVAGIAEDVTERKRLENDLRESEQRFRELAESIDSVFWLNTLDQSQALYVSPAFEDIWGLPVEAMAEDPAAFADAVHPEDRATLDAFLEAQRNREAEAEYRIVRPDGEVRWIRDRAFPIRDASGETVRIAGIAEDVTEQKHLETELRKSQHRLELAISGPSIVLFSVAADGTFTLSRGSGLRRSGLKPGELEGQKIQQVYGGDEAIYQAWEKALQGQRVRDRFEVSGVWCDIDAVPRREQGEVVAVDGIAIDVTDKVEAEQALKEHRRRLEFALEGLPMILFTVSPEGRFTLAQGHGLEHLGIAPEDAIGRHVSELYGDNEQVMQLLDRVLAGERITTRVTLEARVFQTQFVPVHDARGHLEAVHGLAIDVTEQTEVEAELEQRDQILREMSENVDAILWVASSDFEQIEYVSPAFERILGVPVGPFPEDASAFIERVHEDDRDTIVQIFNRPATAPEASPFEYRIWDADGRQRWFRTSLDRVRGEDGTVDRIVGVTYDVTSERAAQEAREERIQAEAELDKLRETNRFKTEFLNTAAHELSTPLTPIGLQMEGLTSGMFGDLTDEQEESLDLLSRNFERLQRLVDDILDTARIQQGRIRVKVAPMDLDEAVSSVVATMTPAAEAANVTLASSLVEHVEIDGDRDRVEQVLLNLLDNAVKYTPRGGNVRLSLEREDASAVIRVEDTGIGMRADQLEELFVPFHRVHEGQDRDRPGTGLGLYICKGLVEAHGGTILADSNGPGQGSTFTVRLPVAPSGEAAGSESAREGTANE